MASDRNKIDYAKKALRRKYLGVALTAGPLEAGKYYLVSVFGSGDDFKNVGVKRNCAGQTFKATGTTPTVWANGSMLNEVKLADLKAAADVALVSATDPVTLTSGAFEGGSGSGEITFPRDVFGQALEELIEEFDPGYVAPVVIPRREIGMTVRVGC